MILETILPKKNDFGNGEEEKKKTGMIPTDMVRWVKING